MDNICQLQITKSGIDQYILEWGAGIFKGALLVQISDNAENFDDDAIVVSKQAERKGFASIIAPNGSKRFYFKLSDSIGFSIVCAERALGFSGGINFRDIGGYAVTGGRRVSWSRIFRSGHLSNLTASDLDFFKNLNVRRVCDFRLVEEREKENARLPNNPELITLEIMPGVGDPRYFHKLFQKATHVEEVVVAMRTMMSYLISDNLQSYKNFFDELLNHSAKGALLINCSAGKERTGIGVALLLRALGVPQETVLYDFMLSKIYFPAELEVDRVLEKYGVSNEEGKGVKLIWPLLETRESYLKSAFETVDSVYGSMDNFLESGLGLDKLRLAELRRLYTV
jgi:protein-tyrosine phosphatase